MFSTKNALVLVVAMVFALYQFNKHSNRTSKRSGSFQLDETRNMLTRSLDMWKYEIIQGKNNRDDGILLIVSRDSKTKGQKRPVIMAEIIADKRMEHRSRRNHKRKHRRGDPYDPRSKKRRRSSSRSKGGRYGRHSHRDRDRSSDRGSSGSRDRISYYDGPPLLRLIIYDVELEGLQEMLELAGFIERLRKDKKTVGSSRPSISDNLGSNSNSNSNSNRPTISTQTKEQQEEINKQELIKRERVEERKRNEESVKTKEEASKRKEEARKDASQRESKDYEVKQKANTEPVQEEL